MVYLKKKSKLSKSKCSHIVETATIVNYIKQCAIKHEIMISIVHLLNSQLGEVLHYLL